MVSYIQIQGYGLEQGFKGVVKPSSGRPKAQGLKQDDQFFWYTYSSTGALIKKEPKDPLHQYKWFLDHVVETAKWKRGQVEGYVRTTPNTDFEIAMGIGQSVEVWNYGGTFYNTQAKTEQFRKENPNFEWYTNDGNPRVQFYPLPDLPTTAGESVGSFILRKAEEKDLIVVSLANLEFKKKPNPAVIEKIPETSRPNPREVEKVEPIEVEPIKEVEKYSPLMIAGILVVIVLLLRRRKA
jgi:hypothetical protein